MNSSLISLIKFVISGLTAAAIELCSFLFLIHVIDRGLILSNSISFILGLITSFSLNKLWVFRGKQRINTKKQFLFYVVLAIFNLLITNILIHLIVGADVKAEVAKIMTICLIAVWNFAIFKLVIFKIDDQSELTK